MIVLYYDGDCPMCHRLVIWLLKRNKEGVLHFSSIQSEAARKRLGSDYNNLVEMDTVILELEGEIYTRSTAAIKAISMMPSWRRIARILLLFPKSLRDIIYRFVAKNRHRLWATCPNIPPEYRSRFL